MNYYFYRLNSPRPTFPADITPAEGALMREHVTYWHALMQQGHVVAFGPVADPRGAYGMGIIRLADGTDPTSLGANDPTIRADVGFTFEVHPMPQVVIADG